MTTHLTIVGGGLGGLTAAMAAREAGLEVTLHEAKARFGGRGRSTGGPYVANWGPHVIYRDGDLYPWLKRRGLLPEVARAPLTKPLLFRRHGRARRLPPARLVAGLVKLRRASPPVDRSFRDWTAGVLSYEVADQLGAFMGVATFHHDPGSLSAAFVHERLKRVTGVPPTARYAIGGWGALVDRMADRARSLGVELVISSPADSLPPPPVILAVPLHRAAALLGEPLVWSGTRTALLDLGLKARRGDPFIVSDLDECGWVETFSYPDPSLVPDGERLVQGQMPLRPGESLDSGLARLEKLVGCGYRDWPARVTWRRQAKVSDETGALDPPGSTWRVRPSVDRGGGVMVVGDMVAAPGLLSEVSHASALDAVTRLTAQSSSASFRARPTVSGTVH